MKHSVEIVNELFQISPLLAGLDKTNLFSIPEGYFNNLPSDILRQLKTDRSISFSGLEETILTVPEGYFENLSADILNKIKALEKNRTSLELKELSPVLYSLKDKKVFLVPHGYFDQLSDDIFHKINRPQAKVISINQRNTVWKIGVAAMITGVIAVSSLWISQKSIDTTGLALKEASVITPIYNNEEQVNEGIAKLSDDDIIKYLQITGNDTDNESLTASFEEKELPAQQDYLLDEKTLQNYLDKIETNFSN
jgi:hypothetical protein